MYKKRYVEMVEIHRQNNKPDCYIINKKSMNFDLDQFGRLEVEVSVVPFELILGLHL